MSDRWIPETLSQAQAGLRDPRLEVPATRSLHSGGGGRRLRSEHTEHFGECPSVTGTVQRGAGV